MELKRIGLLNIQQPEKSLLTMKAFEKFRVARNKQRQAERERIMEIIAKHKQQQQIQEKINNIQVLRETAGGPLFDAFVKKFSGKVKNER